LGQAGRQYKVGIYHGNKSGHLMVYCNSSVVLVDFHVKETKTYSFFIDDEFFELQVEKKDDEFLYGLELNTTVDTPLNKIRKSRDKLHLIKVGLLAVAILIGVIGLVWGIPKFRASKSYEEKKVILSEKGVDTTVEVRYDSIAKVMKYFFVGSGKSIYGEVIFENDNTPIFPLESGETFSVRYAKNAPEIYEINWRNLPDKQIVNYKKRTERKHKSQNPTYSDLKISCEVELAYRIEKLNGLAQLFYQNERPETNPKFNKDSYLKFVRDEPFRSLSKENCWP